MPLHAAHLRRQVLQNQRRLQNVSDRKSQFKRFWGLLNSYQEIDDLVVPFCPPFSGDKNQMGSANIIYCLFQDVPRTQMVLHHGGERLQGRPEVAQVSHPEVVPQRVPARVRSSG